MGIHTRHIETPKSLLLIGVGTPSQAEFSAQTINYYHLRFFCFFIPQNDCNNNQT